MFPRRTTGETNGEISLSTTMLVVLTNNGTSFSKGQISWFVQLRVVRCWIRTSRAITSSTLTPPAWEVISLRWCILHESEKTTTTVRFLRSGGYRRLAVALVNTLSTARTLEWCWTLRAKTARTTRRSSHSTSTAETTRFGWSNQ